MKKNEKLKFSGITHGQMAMSDDMKKHIARQKEIMDKNAKKIERLRVKNVDSTKTEDVEVKRKSHKATKTLAFLLASYLLTVAVVSTNAVNEEYGAKSFGSGSNVVTEVVTEGEEVPERAYLEKFKEILNPIKLLAEIKKSR